MILHSRSTQLSLVLRTSYVFYSFKTIREDSFSIHMRFPGDSLHLRISLIEYLQIPISPLLTVLLKICDNVSSSGFSYSTY